MIKLFILETNLQMLLSAKKYMNSEGFKDLKYRFHV